MRKTRIFGHRIRNETQDRAESERAEDDEHHARHHRRQCQPTVAVRRNDAREHRHKCAGRSANLKSRSAECRMRKPVMIAVQSP